MTQRDKFLNTHPEFHPGMVAYSRDGEALGEVQKLDEENLTIEKGTFFSTDYRLPYDAVEDIRGDHLIVNRDREDLSRLRGKEYGGWEEPDLMQVEEPELAVPVEDLEEQEAYAGYQPSEKSMDATRVEVPVDDFNWDTSTEQTPAGERTGPMAGGESFRDEEITIPLVQEELEVHKRPVAKEDVRGRKETRTEERDVSGEVRKEDIKVEREHPKKK